MLETVAAVPGMVGATLQHLKSLRRMQDDGGWIHTLLEEAENERMHLMTFIEIAKPTLLERWLVLLAQGVFYNGFFLLYLVSSRTAHRVVGYFEEEAIVSYTEYLAEIESGRIENVAAPQIAIDYWKLGPDARLKDVVIAVRADEAGHRDVNHGFADELSQVAAGWLAGQIVQGTGFGLIADIAIGIVGAFIGSWLLPRLGIHLGAGIVAAIIVATIGAIVLLIILRLFNRRGRW